MSIFADPSRTPGSRRASTDSSRLRRPDPHMPRPPWAPVQRIERPRSGLAATSGGGSVPNRSGLPDRLKAGVEALSGLSMDDVRVHRNSAEPARLGALAYAQGSDIHLGPGQERHLPHEAWHVVQQKQGRVTPRLYTHGVAINDETGLEREADVLGAKSCRGAVRSLAASQEGTGLRQSAPSGRVVQAVWIGENPEHWDQPIDGVQWFRALDGRIWYELLGGAAERFGRYAGENHARTAEQWDQLESQLVHVERMKGRISGYDATPGINTDSKSKKPRRDRVSRIDRDVATPVLLGDPQTAVPLTGWTEIDDAPLPLRQGGNTKFINMFRHPHGGGPVDAVVMRENYRERDRPFFASDAFFSQWMASAGYASLEEIPETFPRYFYRNNISNDALQPRLNELLGDSNTRDVEIPGEVWNELQHYDNVKSTQTIIADFNKLNATRGRPPVAIIAMKIIKGPGIRFEIA